MPLPLYSFHHHSLPSTITFPPFPNSLILVSAVVGECKWRCFPACFCSSCLSPNSSHIFWRSHLQPWILSPSYCLAEASWWVNPLIRSLHPQTIYHKSRGFSSSQNRSRARWITHYFGLTLQFSLVFFLNDGSAFIKFRKKKQQRDGVIFNCPTTFRSKYAALNISIFLPHSKSSSFSIVSSL